MHTDTYVYADIKIMQVADNTDIQNNMSNHIVITTTRIDIIHTCRFPHNRSSHKQDACQEGRMPAKRHSIWHSPAGLALGSNTVVSRNAHVINVSQFSA